ncbi:VanZ family protein [Microbacterium sp. ARD32]|uniref:VanZ family protein n=1 Tax=Microbacterium sp. ARD32 TaxID=2962577 RepID=UPI0028817F16|nr:VanZ family protein [Microbacterium sp. ARD32]MDT0156386.1 VanZ family protein [Microbacterium sp. ARD32]
MTDEITRMLSAAPERPAVPPAKSRLRASIAIALLLVYVAVVLVMTMSPTPLDRGYESSIDKVLGVLHRNGVPEWFGYSKLEFTANIAMFVPLGFLVGLALPQRIAWLGLLLLPAFSGVIEMTQSLMLAERFATIEDVIANSAGGWIGLLIAFSIRAMVHARDQKVIARAEWELRHRRW